MGEPEVHFSPALAMQQAIREELFSPVILPYRKDLINKVIKLVVESEAAQEAEEASLGRDLALYELDRIKFYLKRYFRIRNSKIEARIFYIYQNDLSHLLSKAEFDYALSYYKSITKQYHETFFKHVSAAYGEQLFFKNVAEKEKQSYLPLQMVEGPSEGQFVFAMALERVEGFGVGRGALLTLQKSDVLFVPFKYVKQLLEKKRMELV